MSNNKIRNPFYVSTAWVKIRNAYIREFILCEICSKKGLVIAATEVDHIIPIKIDYELRLEWTNLQALCHRCHMKKTKAVDDRLLRGLKPKPWQGADVYGYPIDSEVW